MDSELAALEAVADTPAPNGTGKDETPKEPKEPKTGKAKAEPETKKGKKTKKKSKGEADDGAGNFVPKFDGKVASFDGRTRSGSRDAQQRWTKASMLSKA